MPTTVIWPRKVTVNGVTIDTEVMWRMLVESQTEQGFITSTGWSWLYSVASSAPVHQLHRVHKHSSPPVTVNVAVEPCLVRENHCPLVVGCYGHLCWTQPLLAGEVAPPHVKVGAWLQGAREVLHGLCQSSNLTIGVLPDQGPASSIQLHLTEHLCDRREGGGQCALPLVT